MFYSKTLPAFPFAKALPTFLAAIMVMVAASVCATPASANPKYASIVVDANNGKTLHARHADSLRYPASLTKMMTLYMLFEAMHQGKVSKNTRIVMSRHAASMQPSKLGIPVGKSISAEDAILALVTKSANDVAAAVGEHLGGTESEFAEMMTRKARQLGMSKTTYRNASGLPDSRQVTTARDQATLGIALQEHFPREFKYFSTRSFKFGRAHFRNHNRLLGKVKGVDGIKTGYIRASGFNLVTSVNTGGRSIVAVVFGGRSGATRNAHMEELIANNLRKGSTRDRGPLVARNGTVGFSNLGGLAAMDPAALPRPVPAPRAVEVATAESVPAILQPSPKPVVNPAQPAATASSYAAAPRPTVPVAVRPTVTVRPPKPVATVDEVTTGSTPTSRSGWVIQIASLPSQSEAVAYLRNAQTRAKPVLGSRDPFVEQFVKGSTTYHRARFAGFSSKSDAWGACEALKKFEYACLAFDNS